MVNHLVHSINVGRMNFEELEKICLCIILLA